MVLLVLVTCAQLGLSGVSSNSKQCIVNSMRYTKRTKARNGSNEHTASLFGPFFGNYFEVYM
jgi:hypothetical protein